MDWELYEEADKRGLLSGEKKTLFEEAKKRGLIGAAPKASGDDPSRMESFGRGALQSATFNLSDEAYGLAKGAYDKVLGSGDFSGTYTKERDAVRAANEKAAEVNPGSYLTGQVAGSVAIPMGAARVATLAPQAAAKVAPTLARAGFGATSAPGAGIVAGAREGAAYGAAMGFGAAEGGLEDQVAGTVGGGLIGGAAGGLLPAISRGAAAVFRPVTDDVNAVVRPTPEAARRTATALDLDAQGQRAVDDALGPPSARQTAVEQEAQRLANAGVLGGEMRLIDMGGSNVTALARSAANVSPVARDILHTASNRRWETQGERAVDFIRSRIPGLGNAARSEQELRELARTVNRPAYARAVTAGDREIWSPKLAQLSGSPMVRKAMEAAAERGKDRAIADGFGAFNTRVQFQPGGNVVFTKGKEGVPTYPNLQYWDYVKRELDDMWRSARNSGEQDIATVGQTLTRQLRQELDQAVPEYQAARGTAATFFDAEDALDAGQVFARGGAGMTSNQAELALARMHPNERQFFQEGYLSELLRKVEGTGDRRNIVGVLANSPDKRRQLSMVFGPDRAREIEAFVHIENVMDGLRTALGNSTTARQISELKLAGIGTGLGALASGGDLTDPKAWIVGALTYGGRRGFEARQQQMAINIARMLTSNDPQVVQRAMNVAANNPSIMGMLRNASSYLSGGRSAATGAAAANVAAPEQAN
jgi:hypothetical protein